MERSELAPGAELHGGMLLPRDPALPPIPLEQTEISVAVLGPLADVTVTQRFRSAHSAPLDALYLFPLPADAAVHELLLRIGERTVRGELRAREEARQRFAEAAASGANAALLSQERPNIFAVEVANLQPGATVEVRLRFSERVPFDDGAFALTIPTVVLPRYTPPAAAATAPPQAPLLPAGVVGHTLALSVELNVGKLAELASPSHEIDITKERGQTLVRLRDGAALPDRDFVLRYRPTGASYQAAGLSYRAAGQPGTLLVMLTPQAAPTPSDILPRELLFVIDRSGSMGGESIAQARNALRACLRALNPGDTFNIFPFDNHVEQLAAQSLAFTQASVDLADSYIAGITARGGTEILGALETALRQPSDPARLRVLVFLTDGAVGNEEAVLRALDEQLRAARVFAFGVGSAVNRYLLDKLAEVGRGSVEYILPGEPIEPAIQRFQGRAALPLLRDLSLDWGGARVSDLLPDPLPDLYAGQPLLLLARFHGPRDEQATLRLSGQTARGPYREALEIELPAATPERGGVWALLPQLWARARLDRLLSAIGRRDGRAAELEAEAEALALQYGLLSPYTSFVALEELPPDPSGRRATERVVVPTHLPAGTQREAFSGPPPPPSLGVFYSMAPAAAAPPSGGARPKTPSGMAARFLNALRRDSAEGSAPVPAAPTPAASRSSAPIREVRARAISAAERRDTALRFLARTQSVSGSWADDTLVTALAVAAFARAGHSERTGDFRPQLGRAVAWLASSGPHSADPAALLARLGALPGLPADLAATLTAGDEAAQRAALAPLQRHGGDADGAILLAEANPARPGALALGLTAALALVWA